MRFFDVGQGDSALLTSPAGVAILVDGGPDPAQVATELAALGVKRLDLMVASHPTPTTSSGSPAVLARFPVGLLLEPGCRDDSPDGADARRGRLGRAHHGPAPASGRRAPGRRRPTRDPVARPLLVRDGVRREQRRDRRPREHRGGLGPVRDRTRGAGAAGAASTRAWICTRTSSRCRTTAPRRPVEPFFEAVDAEVAVVSVGPNTYGHPVPEVLDWIRATGADVFRTDRAGTVTVTFEEWRRGCRVRRVSPSAAKAAPVSPAVGRGRVPASGGRARAPRRPAAGRGGRRAVAGGETADLATPSLFGERRALLVSDAKALPDEGVRELARYLEAPDPDAPLVTRRGGGGPGEGAGGAREARQGRRHRHRGQDRAQGAPGLDPQAGQGEGARPRAGRRGRARRHRSARSPGRSNARLDQLATAFAGERITREIVARQFRGLGEQQRVGPVRQGVLARSPRRDAFAPDAARGRRRRASCSSAAIASRPPRPDPREVVARTARARRGRPAGGAPVRLAGTALPRAGQALLARRARRPPRTHHVGRPGA